MRSPRSLLRTALSISAATAASRVLGLVRDQVQSYYFGASVVTDAFLAAFRIPNLLRDLFAEGALSSAFVPTFTRTLRERGRGEAWRLVNRLMTLLALMLAAAALLIALGAPAILSVYAYGFAPEKAELAAAMTRIVAPFLLFVALAAVAMGALNSCGRFFVPALAPASFNVVIVLAVVVLHPWLRRAGVEPGLALAIGALAGGAAQFLVQVPSLRREGFRFRPELAPADPGVRRVAWLMLPASFGLAATQVNILVDTMLASLFGDGPITYLALAFRLLQLPIGLFGVSLATANLARVSAAVVEGDLEGLRTDLAASLRTAMVLAIPATAGLIALREPIVRLLFEHGRFTARDSEMTAAAVLCYALGLFAYAAGKIQVPTFYALGRTRLAVRASVGAVGVKLAANVALILLLGRIGVAPFLGLALATALAAWGQFAWLGRGLRREIGSLRGRQLGATFAKMSGLAALLGAACSVAHGGLERALPGGGTAGEAGRLGLAVALGLALAFGGAVALRVPEGGMLIAAARRALRGAASPGPPEGGSR